MEYNQHCNKVYGFTVKGYKPVDDNESPLAAKVLVVVVIGLTGSWRLPIMYYLMNAKNSRQRFPWPCGFAAWLMTADLKIPLSSYQHPFKQALSKVKFSMCTRALTHLLEPHWPLLVELEDCSIYFSNR